MKHFLLPAAFRKPLVQDLALIFLLGLTPLLWFRELKLLNSEDLMVPPSWQEFTRFWYVWNDQLGTGAQKILDSGRFVTLFIAAALQGMGLGVIPAQMIQFVFWFTLPGLAMYYLMAGVYRGPDARLSRVAAVLFYMFNLWLISNWIGYKEPLIAAVAILPFLLGIWIRAFASGRGYVRAILTSSLVSLLASSIGNNTSEMLVALVPLPVLFVFEVAEKALRRNWRGFARAVLSGVALAGLLLALHAFWLVPMVLGIRYAVAIADFPDFQRSSLQFLEGQSLYTSIPNNIRFVSDWTWYQGLVEPYRTFAQSFTSSSALVFLGWAIFALVVTGGALGRGVKKAYFVTLVVIGLILSAGLHSPTGPLYAFAVDKVPFFWIVRSPWFKFTLFTVIGYSVLLGLAAPLIARTLRAILSRAIPRFSLAIGHVFAGGTVLAVFAAAGPVYSYPFALGLFFATPGERTFLNPNHIAPPGYVAESGAWINARDGDFRVLVLPGDSPWLSDWGYSGFGSYLQSLTLRSISFKHSTQSVKVSQGAPDSGGPVTQVADADLLDERSESVARLLGRLGIRYVVHERDVRFDFYQGEGYRTHDSPVEVSRILASLPGIRPAAAFGKWDIYEVDSPSPKFWAAPSLVAVDGLDAWQFARLDGSGWFDRGVFADSNEIPPTARRLIRERVAQTGEAQVLAAGTAGSAAMSPLIPAVGIELEFGAETDWGAEEALTPDAKWRWMGKNLGEHYVLRNRSATLQYAEIRLDVWSHARERTFYVYINGELLRVETVPPDSPRAVRLTEAPLRPGRNVVSFYTPFAADPRHGQNVSFAIQQDPQVGRARFDWAPRVPRPGSYNLLLTVEPISADAWPAGMPDTVEVEIDDSALTARRIDGLRASYSAAINLRPESTIRLTQQGREQYFMLLAPSDREPSAQPVIEVRTLRSSPTSYKISLTTPSPAVLVFNESFHRDWKASVNGKPATAHFKVDDYANAYAIDDAGTYQIEIEFEPQRYFVWSFAGSATLTAALAAALCWMTLRARRNSSTKAGASPPPSPG